LYFFSILGQSVYKNNYNNFLDAEPFDKQQQQQQQQQQMFKTCGQV
jgi:hypothetical protein